MAAIFLANFVINVIELLPELHDFVVEPDLLSDIGNHELKFCVSIIVEPLVIFNFLVNIIIFFIENFQLADVMF